MAGKAKTYSFINIFCLLVLFIPSIAAYLKYSKREKIEGVEDTDYNKPNLTGMVISNVVPKFSVKDRKSVV